MNGGNGFTKYFAAASNGSMWIILYNNLSNTTVYYSYDLITFSASSLGAYTICIAASSSVWVAGGGTEGGQPAIRYSIDGITWSTSSSAQSIVGTNGGIVRGIGYNGVLWVAVGILNGAGTGAFAMYSPDGITWTQSTDFTSLTTSMTRVNPVWNGNVWVAGCNGTNSILYSYDAITWSAATSASTFITSPLGLSWNGSLFICTGAGTDTVMKSPDGINWSASSASSLIPTTAAGVASRRVLFGRAAQGSVIYGDTGAPSNALGSLGSFYIDLSTGWLWRKV